MKIRPKVGNYISLNSYFDANIQYMQHVKLILRISNLVWRSCSFNNRHNKISLILMAQMLFSLIQKVPGQNFEKV